MHPAATRTLPPAAPSTTKALHPITSQCIPLHPSASQYLPVHPVHSVQPKRCIPLCLEHRIPVHPSASQCIPVYQSWGASQLPPAPLLPHSGSAKPPLFQAGFCGAIYPQVRIPSSGSCLWVSRVGVCPHCHRVPRLLPPQQGQNQGVGDDVARAQSLSIALGGCKGPGSPLVSPGELWGQGRPYQAIWGQTAVRGTQG